MGTISVQLTGIYKQISAILRNNLISPSFCYFLFLFCFSVNFSISVIFVLFFSKRFCIWVFKRKAVETYLVYLVNKEVIKINAVIFRYF